MSSGAAIVARFECPASGSARRGSRGRSHTRTLHGGPGRSGRLTMIGATRSIALPTKTRVAQGAGSWVGRLLHLEPQVTREPNRSGGVDDERGPGRCGAGHRVADAHRASKRVEPNTAE